MLILCAALLLAALWGTIGAIAAWRRPVYTFTDWKNASVRICRAMRRLRSARCPASGSGHRFHRRVCYLLLQDLLANTVFIVNLVNDGPREPRRRLHQSAICTGDILSRAVRLLVRLQYGRLQLFFWPLAARDARPHVLAIAESYVRLCVALTGFLEHSAC